MRSRVRHAAPLVVSVVLASLVCSPAVAADPLAELTPEAVRDVMQRRFNLTRRVLVSVGPVADQQPLPASDQ